MATSTEDLNIPEGFLVAPRVPQGLAAAVEGLTREVIRQRPEDIYVFAAHHFERLLHLREAYGVSRSLSVDERNFQVLRDMSETLRKRDAFQEERNSRDFAYQSGWSLSETAKVLERHRSIFGEEGRKISTEEVRQLASEREREKFDHFRRHRSLEKRTSRRKEESRESAGNTRNGLKFISQIPTLPGSTVKDIKSELRKNRLGSRERRNLLEKTESESLKSTGRTLEKQMQEIETRQMEEIEQEGRGKFFERKSKGLSMDRVKDYVVKKFSTTRSLEELQSPTYVEKVQEVIDETAPIIKERVEELKSSVNSKRIRSLESEKSNVSSENSRSKESSGKSWSEKSRDKSRSSGSKDKARTTTGKSKSKENKEQSRIKESREDSKVKEQKIRKNVKSVSKASEVETTNDSLEDVDTLKSEVESVESKNGLEMRLNETQTLLEGISSAFTAPMRRSSSAKDLLNRMSESTDVSLPVVRPQSFKAHSRSISRSDSDNLVLPPISPEAPKSTKIKEDLVLPVLSRPGSSNLEKETDARVNDETDDGNLEMEVVREEKVVGDDIIDTSSKDSTYGKDDSSNNHNIDNNDPLLSPKELKIVEAEIEEVFRDSLNVTPEVSAAPSRPDSLELEAQGMVLESAAGLREQLLEIEKVEKDIEILLDPGDNLPNKEVTILGKLQELENTEKRIENVLQETEKNESVVEKLKMLEEVEKRIDSFLDEPGNLRKQEDLESEEQKVVEHSESECEKTKENKMVNNSQDEGREDELEKEGEQEREAKKEGEEEEEDENSERKDELCSSREEAEGTFIPSIPYSFVLTEGSPCEIPDSVTTVIIPDRISTPDSDILEVEVDDGEIRSRMTPNTSKIGDQQEEESLNNQKVTDSNIFGEIIEADSGNSLLDIDLISGMKTGYDLLIPHQDLDQIKEEDDKDLDRINEEESETLGRVNVCLKETELRQIVEEVQEKVEEDVDQIKDLEDEVNIQDKEEKVEEEGEEKVPKEVSEEVQGERQKVLDGGEDGQMGDKALKGKEHVDEEELKVLQVMTSSLREIQADEEKLIENKSQALKDLSPEIQRMDSDSTDETKETSITDGAQETTDVVENSFENEESTGRSIESTNEVKETTLTDQTNTSLSLDPGIPIVPELNLDSLQDLTISSFKMTDEEVERKENEETESVVSTTEPEISGKKGNYEEDEEKEDDNFKGEENKKELGSINEDYEKVIVNQIEIEKFNGEEINLDGKEESDSDEKGKKVNFDEEKRDEMNSVDEGKIEKMINIEDLDKQEVFEDIVKEQVEIKEDLCVKATAFVTTSGAEDEDNEKRIIIEKQNKEELTLEEIKDRNQEEESRKSEEFELQEEENEIEVPREEEKDVKAEEENKAKVEEEESTIEEEKEMQEQKEEETVEKKEEEVENLVKDINEEEIDIKDEEKNASKTEEENKEIDVQEKEETIEKKANVIKIENEEEIEANTEEEKEIVIKEESTIEFKYGKEDIVKEKEDIVKEQSAIEFEEGKEVVEDEKKTAFKEEGETKIEEEKDETVVEENKETNFEEEQKPTSKIEEGTKVEDECKNVKTEEESEIFQKETIENEELIELVESRSASQCTTRRLNSANNALKEEQDNNNQKNIETVDSNEKESQVNENDDFEIEETIKAEVVTNAITDDDFESRKECHIYVPDLNDSENSFTDTSSFISAATKIQAGIRGFLTRRRLQSSQCRSSTLDSVPSIQESFVNPVPNSGGESSIGSRAGTSVRYIAGNEEGYDVGSSVVTDVGSNDGNCVGIFSRVESGTIIEPLLSPIEEVPQPTKSVDDNCQLNNRKRLRREDAFQRTTLSLDNAFSEGGLQHTGEFHDCIPLPVFQFENRHSTRKKCPGSAGGRKEREEIESRKAGRHKGREGDSGRKKQKEVEDKKETIEDNRQRRDEGRIHKEEIEESKISSVKKDKMKENEVTVVKEGQKEESSEKDQKRVQNVNKKDQDIKKSRKDESGEPIRCNGVRQNSGRSKGIIRIEEERNLLAKEKLEAEKRKETIIEPMNKQSLGVIRKETGNNSQKETIGFFKKETGSESRRERGGNKELETSKESNNINGGLNRCNGLGTNNGRNRDIKRTNGEKNSHGKEKQGGEKRKEAERYLKKEFNGENTSRVNVEVLRNEKERQNFKDTKRDGSTKANGEIKFNEIEKNSDSGKISVRKEKEIKSTRQVQDRNLSQFTKNNTERKDGINQGKGHINIEDGKINGVKEVSAAISLNGGLVNGKEETQRFDKSDLILNGVEKKNLGVTVINDTLSEVKEEGKENGEIKAEDKLKKDIKYSNADLKENHILDESETESYCVDSGNYFQPGLNYFCHQGVYTSDIPNDFTHSPNIKNVFPKESSFNLGFNPKLGPILDILFAKEDPMLETNYLNFITSVEDMSPMDILKTPLEKVEVNFKYCPEEGNSIREPLALPGSPKKIVIEEITSLEETNLRNSKFLENKVVDYSSLTSMEEEENKLEEFVSLEESLQERKSQKENGERDFELKRRGRTEVENDMKEKYVCSSNNVCVQIEQNEVKEMKEEEKEKIVKNVRNEKREVSKVTSCNKEPSSSEDLNPLSLKEDNPNFEDSSLLPDASLSTLSFSMNIEDVLGLGSEDESCKEFRKPASMIKFSSGDPGSSQDSQNSQLCLETVQSPITMMQMESKSSEEKSDGRDDEKISDCFNGVYKKNIKKSVNRENKGCVKINKRYENEGNNNMGVHIKERESKEMKEKASPRENDTNSSSSISSEKKLKGK